MKARLLFLLPLLAVLILMSGYGVHTKAQVRGPSPKTCTVFGIVQLEGLYRAAAAQPVTFELTLLNADKQINPPKPIHITTWVRAEGRTGFQVPKGVYAVRIKGPKWLATTQKWDARGERASFQATLLCGDLNNDNVVDKSDREIVTNVLFAEPSKEIEIDGRADSNCDDVVDKVDLANVEMNLSRAGL